MQQGRLNTWLTFTSVLPEKLAHFPVGANKQESFRKQLAAGEVVWPTWWEVADAVNHMNYFGRVMSPEKMKD